MEINPAKHFIVNEPINLPDTTGFKSANGITLDKSQNQLENTQSIISLPEGGKVTVEVIYSEAAESAKIDLLQRQPEQQTLLEYANRNIGYIWVSEGYPPNTNVEFGIWWYYNSWGTIYQGYEAGAIITQVNANKYQIGFEAAGDDWDYNELVLDVTIETYLPLVLIDPPNISTGETAVISVKKQYYDGRVEDFPVGQLFEFGIMEGCTAGGLVSGGDTAAYFNGVTQPLLFVAADSLENDEETVKIGVGLIEALSTSIVTNTKVAESVQDKQKAKNELLNKNPETINALLIGGNCFGGEFQSAKIGFGDVVVKKRYEIEILSPMSDSIAWITKEPQMPDAICKAKLKNYDKGKVNFEWEYWISYTLLRREFTKIDTLMRRTGKIQICGRSYSNNSEISNWTVPFDRDSLKYVLLTVKQPEIPGWTRYGGDNNEKRTNWEEGDEIFFGGDVFLQITAKNNNGDVIKFKQQNSGKILGKNPFLQDVLNYITTKEFKAIVKHEAKSKQFNENYINKYNERGYPIYGPPNGYGLAQIDNPPPLEMDLWNWKSNLNRGKSIYDDKKIDAYNFMEKHPNTYTEEMLLKCAFQKYNMYGYEEETKIIHYFWRWDNYQGKWVDDEYIIERTKAKGFKERYGITIWNIYKSL